MMRNSDSYVFAHARTCAARVLRRRVHSKVRQNGPGGVDTIATARDAIGRRHARHVDSKSVMPTSHAGMTQTSHDLACGRRRLGNALARAQPTLT
ncbi:hypothetical protein D7S86_04785 [Pararobbsia silviterrae]|uniref:Uncharacterized protein n=1 Tax=Pararobbsia silviterrae TaxID=1792498 RepID=A0A494Y999_9BURK|nr:hypothetical protein D7S86_04785 [Pararobbsia silviterrae]